MDTFPELRQLADDFTKLGDNATATLARQAIDRFSDWKFEAGERLLEKEARNNFDTVPEAVRSRPLLRERRAGRMIANPQVN